MDDRSSLRRGYAIALKRLRLLDLRSYLVY